jgi:hypothetical protein
VTAAPATLIRDERSFRRVAAIAAIVSVPFAAGNLVTALAAVGFDLNAISRPLALINRGASAATLWHWSMLLDTFGYYLLIVPLVLLLRSALRHQSPNWIDLSVLCLVVYCFIGALGGAMLATAVPTLIKDYATATVQHRAILETTFNGYSDAVYRGLWNMLEEFLGGVAWVSIGLVLRREHHRLGQTTILLGVACLVDGIGTALNLDAVATIGLTLYLVLAPAWACWIGIRFLSDDAPFATAALPASAT